MTRVGLALLLLVGLVQLDCLSAEDGGEAASSPGPVEPVITPYYTETVIRSSFYDDQGQASCSARVKESRDRARARGVSQGVAPTVTMGAALLIFVFVGFFSAGIAKAFTSVRKYVYHDADNLDTAFDAGGKVSIGLTATTIVSQWTWSATLLQSSTVASKYGISGPYWYAGGATIQIIIFSILSIMLKTRAPGAKTFLQVIKARFGKRTHLVFCTFAFLTNLIVMMSLTIAGTAVLNSLVKGLSPEAAAMLLAAVIGGYTLIGGLGATFYVSYFNTTLIFILILMLVVEVFYNPFDNPENPFGSAEAVYDFISCWKAPQGDFGNKAGSYLTFFSPGGLIFGVVNIVGNFGTVFCDQAYWQSSVAAKPLQGVWGFITGGLTWFAIPFTLATTMGLAYLGLSSSQGFPMLSDEDVTRGLAAPLVAQKLLGTTGEYAMLFLILMAVMSTGSAEVIAVASIVIYDVYQTYLCPFRPDLKEGECILCGKPLRAKPGVEELCECVSATNCQECMADSRARAKSKSIVKPHYTCSVHADYKEYQEHLLTYKNWAIILTTFLSIPLCMFCWAVSLNLAWTFYFTGILISCSVVPIALSILWARATSTGLMAGVVGGCMCGMISWLAYASTYPGGLSGATFVKNTGEDLPMLLGNLVSITVGAIASIMVSYCTRWRMTKEDEEAEWEKTRDIDNPLSPWVQVYKGELSLEEGDNFHDRPPLELVIRKFHLAKLTSFTAAVAFSVFFVGIWPATMLSVDIMDGKYFNIWTLVSRGWAFIAAAFIVIVPLGQELRAIYKQMEKNKVERKRVVYDTALSQPLSDTDNSCGGGGGRGGNNSCAGSGEAINISSSNNSHANGCVRTVSSASRKQEFLLQHVRNMVGRIITKGTQ